MRQQGRWPRLMGRLVLAAGILTGWGCHHLLPHEAEKPPTVLSSCSDLPPCCRDGVHIFLIHGTDPLDFGNLTGLNAYLRELGYRKTYLGQLYHRNEVLREVRRIHSCDPDARFVLIGFSLGSNMVRDVANAVQPEGTHIDLLVYLGGNTLEDVPHDRPENVGKIVNILARGWIWNGTTFTDAENINLPDVFHFGSPMHPATRQMLARELTIVATRVPITQPAGQLPGGSMFDEPTPRPVSAAPTSARDAWDFLKPVGFIPAPALLPSSDGHPTGRLARETAASEW